MHEALIREWQRLRHWINTDREFLVWRQRLADARRVWEQQGREDGYLLREAPLALALDWLQKRVGGIAAEDRAFIDASRTRASTEQWAAQRRRRLALIASTTAAAVFFALFVGAGFFWSEASSQRRAAQINQSLYHADQSQQQLRAGNPELAIRLALAALPAVLERRERPYVGEAEAQLYRAVAADRAVAELIAGDPVWRAVPSPHGELILLASEGGRLLLFTSDAHLLQTMEGHAASVLDAEFSPDGASVVSASVDGTARLWDLASKDTQVLAGHDDVVVRARFSPDGELVATAAWDGTARVWERASGALRHTLSGHEGPLTALTFDSAGARLATTSLDGTARVWDVATGQAILGPLEAHESPLWDVAFSPSGDRLLTAAEGRQVIGQNLGVNPSERADTVRIWDADSGAPLLTLDGHPAGVLRARFSPATLDVPEGAAMTATASRDGTARLWDAVTGRQISVLEGHIEVFVGVGASRVRKMFDEAKKRAPCIVFIDELDAVGRVRGTGLGGGNDERGQTLNQILSEMDGFEGREAVIVLAATNRPDVLDPALLRPGRFDRHVTLELPDKVARLAILQVHTRKVPLGPNVDLAQVAAGTPGFSGADLKNLVNEAAMMAAREDQANVSPRHLDEMREKLLMGSVRTLAIQPEERRRLAVHEAGHTTVAHFLPHADPLYKVSIIPRGHALGITHLLPEEERHTLPEDYLKDRLAVMMGGRVAEKLILGGVSLGADDDIRQATALARAMVARWGMAEEVGPVDLRQSEEHPFLGREIAQPRLFSQETAHEVDEAVRRLITEAEQRSTEVVSQYRAQAEHLVEELERHETLDRAQIDACLGPARERQQDAGKPPLAAA